MDQSVYSDGASES
jgi:hypothetical protein